MHRPWDLGHRAEPRVVNVTANRELGLTRDALNIGSHTANVTIRNFLPARRQMTL